MKIINSICATFLISTSLWAQTVIGQLSVTSWDFGPTLIGCTSAPKNISLANTGDAQLVMNSIALSGPFALPVNHCAHGVRPGTHCNVSVTYSASSLATDTGTLAFNDNASNTPQTVALSGHGATIVPTQSKPQKPSPNTVYYGQTTTFTGQVVSLGGCSIPDGELLSFHNNSGFVYCRGLTLVGVASCTAQIFAKPGPYVINVSYPGDARFEPSDSTNNNIALHVYKWQSTTTLTASPNPANVGQTVTMTATVSSSGPYVPTGTVDFYVNGVHWKRVSLSNGIAQTNYTFTAAGNWILRATYSGDVANYGSPRGGTSVTEVVNP